MESIKDGMNRIGSMQVSEPVRTKNMEKNSWKQPHSWKIIKGTHQEIIADIEEKMRWGLDSSKAVKKVLPKHKHQFESLIEYKSDDEDDSDTDADSLEDKTTITI